MTLPLRAHHALALLAVASLAGCATALRGRVSPTPFHSDGCSLFPDGSPEQPGLRCDSCGTTSPTGAAALRRSGWRPIWRFGSACWSGPAILSSPSSSTWACGSGALYTEPGWNMHTPEEIGIDGFQASRSPDGRYRTTPLRGLASHAKRGFYHDGRFATLADVVDHYDSFFHLGLSGAQKADLVQYLSSL